MTTTSRITGLLLAAGALALTACGGSNSTSTATTTTPTPTRTVGTATIESGIKQQLSTPSAEVTKVSCPTQVSAATGTSFTCSVTWSNGATGKVKTTEKSPGQYTYEAVPGSVQIPGSSVEQQVEKALAQEGIQNAQANCPDTIVVKAGSTVTCDVSNAGGGVNGTVTFTFSNDEGTVDPSSVKTT